jgi:predicted DNA binding CopG/RHH family protein
MRKEYDLDKLKKRANPRIDPDPKVMISLRMDPHDISLLRDEADRMGMPYQTLIGSIIHRFVTGELIDKKEAKKIAG